MEPVMLIVTLVALALCGVMAAITARLLREERRRSAARVAMLEEVMHTAPATPGRDTSPTAGDPLHGVEMKSPVGRAPAPAVVWVDEERHPLDAFPIRPKVETRTRPVNPQIGSVDLFGSTAAPTGTGLRLAGVVAVGAVVLAIAVGALVFSTGSARDGASVAAGTTSDPSLSAQPLHLVALRHTRTDSGLTISGVIRNPEGGTERAHLTAVVFLFDRQGSFLTSARVKVEPATLPAGQASPFSVDVPQAGSVGRYRVSFRTDVGVVPHVDRRDEMTGRRAQS